jgi:uncharacterized protein YjiK
MKRISIIVTLFLLMSACKEEQPQGPVIEIPTGTIELIESYELDVTEPSGLCFGPENKTLLTVSDNTNKVYELDLKGKVLRTLDYTGKDLEGVAYNPGENVIAVAEEADREVTLINYTSGQKIETYKIDISFGADNSGLEGISYNLNNKLYYIVNETNPDLMVVWNPVSGIINKDQLDFASDYSGICADAAHSLLWIVSDQSERVYKCDYNANVLLQFELDELKFEGIAIQDDLIYLVNDATAELNVYQIKNN